MNDAILEVEGLTKRYGTRLAVNNLSFTVRRGDLYGFLGRNGSGKSTTIRMILGLVRPTAGQVRVVGHRIRAGGRKDPWPVGAIIESPIFYDYLSARTNVEMLASLSGGASAQRIDEVIELVGLTDRQHEKVLVYSHGMRQRLGLAQALLPNPDLIILDEPLDGLDPNGIREIRDVMLNLVKDGGVTIFLSSHILSEVEMTCERVVVIHEGKSVYEGRTEDLITDPKKLRLRTADGGNPTELLGSLPYVEASEKIEDGWSVSIERERVPELNRELVGAGFDVLELTPLKVRLEDVFIRLTENVGTSAEKGEDGSE